VTLGKGVAASLDRRFLSEDADKLLGSFGGLNDEDGDLRWVVCVALVMVVRERKSVKWTGQVARRESTWRCDKNINHMRPDSLIIYCREANYWDKIMNTNAFSCSSSRV